MKLLGGYQPLRLRAPETKDDLAAAGSLDFACEIKLAGADDAAPGTFEGYASVFGVLDTGGDIVLPGTLGKLTAIVTMIIGISLFVRLAQAIVRPYKVTFPCPQCGLSRHDADAVHCKACGHVLNIPDEGA